MVDWKGSQYSCSSANRLAPAVSAFLKRYRELSVDTALSRYRFEPSHVNLVNERRDLAIRIGVLEDSPLVVRQLAPLGSSSVLRPLPQ